MNPRKDIDILELEHSPNLRRAKRLPPIITPKTGTPETPEGLTADELAVWASVIALLSERGTLTPGDVYIVRQFAIVQARHLRLCAEIQAEGLVVSLTRLTNHGAPVQIQTVNPRLKLCESTERALLKLSRELGLTPARRGAVKQAQPEKEPKPGTVGWFEKYGEWKPQ